jgi:DNA-binding LacI/PurR family transcriptional regulator
VRQDFNEMGRRGLHVLLEEIAGGAHNADELRVTPELIVRKSAAPPR